MSTTEKANSLMDLGDFNKVSLAKELGITRPTLDTRLNGSSEWKVLETKWIDILYNRKFS